ncbi:MAG: hypothetical protein QM642_11360 [Edaphocola sp.]
MKDWKEIFIYSVKSFLAMLMVDCGFSLLWPQHYNETLMSNILNALGFALVMVLFGYGNTKK